MSDDQASRDRGGAFVHANGIGIHYVEMGDGEPLVLLHGGVVSTGPIWNNHPVSYNAHLGRLAEHFRVIAPDTRGAGATVHKNGTASFALLAEDVLALIDALRLDRPMIAGFSEGGATATLVGITQPDAVRAIVNDAGFDVFDPHAPTFAMMRQMLGGSPDAAESDPDAAAAFFSQSPEMDAMFELMKADCDAAQGEGYWRTYLELAFPRTTRSPGYTFDDWPSISAPTLVLTGDRDMFCSVEDAVRGYRALRNGELAVLPDHDHSIQAAAVDATIEFLCRHAT
jgi:pimeloyl-ACP methyl ester carboxylesterase